MPCNVDANDKPPDGFDVCTWTDTVRFLYSSGFDSGLELPVRLLANTKDAVVAEHVAGAKPPLSAALSSNAKPALSASWDINAAGRPWQWKRTKSGGGTLDERRERVPGQRCLRFGPCGRFGVLREPNRGDPPAFRDTDLVALTFQETRDAGTNVGRPPSDGFAKRCQTFTRRIVTNIVGNETAGRDGDLFDIDPDTGQNTAKQPCDFESAKEHCPWSAWVVMVRSKGSIGRRSPRFPPSCGMRYGSRW